jgi:hypothetical protein
MHPVTGCSSDLGIARPAVCPVRSSNSRRQGAVQRRRGTHTDCSARAAGAQVSSYVVVTLSSSVRPKQGHFLATVATIWPTKDGQQEGLLQESWRKWDFRPVSLGDRSIRCVYEPHAPLRVASPRLGGHVTVPGVARPICISQGCKPENTPMSDGHVRLTKPPWVDSKK